MSEPRSWSPRSGLVPKACAAWRAERAWYVQAKTRAATRCTALLALVSMPGSTHSGSELVFDTLDVTPVLTVVIVVTIVQHLEKKPLDLPTTVELINKARQLLKR